MGPRRGEHERQRAITPPPWVGQPPQGGGGRFDAPELDRADTDHEVRGAGASAGVVRRPARVTLGQEDFDRIQAGDVIVCPSSNPSWVPLFSIAAGLVADTRGLLSHAYTRIYFADETEANARDPVLAAVPEERRPTLLARPDENAPGKTYRFDIFMQGERETVFFDV